MDTERRSITRPDGRVIEFLVAGPADGLPLVLHEGTPVGLVLYPPTVQASRCNRPSARLRRRPQPETVTLTPASRCRSPVVAVACTTALALGA
jgi:hypothetical protein